VGSGPFVFESIQPGSQISIKANPSYWGGAPYLDRVVIQGIPDEATLAAGLMAGSIGLTDFAPISQIPQFKSNPALRVELAPPAVTVFLALNALFKPLNNKLVRQAINVAVNRDTMVRVVFPYGTGVTPAGIVTPNMWTYFPALQRMGHYDPDRAKSLLKRAGLPNGFKAVLQVQNTSYWPLLGQVLQADLARVGIDVTLQKLEAGTFWSGIFAGKSMMSVTTRTSLVPDPDDFLTPILRSDQQLAQKQTANSTYPDAHTLDHELNAALATTNLAVRKQDYLKIQQRLLNDVPYVYLAYVRLPVVMSSKVHDVDVGALGSYQLYLHRTWMSP
jgi:ABC-type transport system substrate-binding protein